MKPKNSPQAEAAPLRLFQSRLDSQINSDHPLCQLAERIDWDRFDDAYAPLYCKDNGELLRRQRRIIAKTTAHYCEDNGAPALPTRLMVALEYLKYTYNLSDEALVMRWLALKTFTGPIGNTSAAKLMPYNAIKMGVAAILGKLVLKKELLFEIVTISV